jgi:type IV secretory pathway VirB2 component (pilin)
MKNEYLGIIANVFAAIGIVACAISGINRIFGSYYVFGYEAMTFFIGGISLMVFAALIKLHLIHTGIAGEK